MTRRYDVNGENGTVTLTQDTSLTVSELRAQLDTARVQEYRRVIREGFVISGTGSPADGARVRADTEARSQFDQAAQLLALAQSDAAVAATMSSAGGQPVFEVTTEGGDILMMTLALAQGLVRAVAIFSATAAAHETALKRQIDAATTIAELQAIDVTTGWPS